jgi:uncharacterized protein (DUF1800 family)
MKKASLWSLRLGFSNKQASEIEKLGLEKFLSKSFETQYDAILPEFLKDEPKTIEDLKATRDSIKNATKEEQTEIIKSQVKKSIDLKNWWINKMQHEELPLHEKMVCFWHNHFVATTKKVKVNYWIYQHNMVLRKNAFGNFKILTKEIIKTNAMVRYLDNVDNKKGKLNENLSRELLELFTLGIGNYSEDDIKNGAKALAGLNLGENGAVYRKFQQDNEAITYLGKRGNFKVDDLIDIIFEQPNIPFLITRKILKWFIYDNPSQELVSYYGNYFKKVNFEIQPLLTKIFIEEYPKENAGSKIKDPLTYILQLMHELHIEQENKTLITFFLSQQGMDLMNQPNVKGWDGGNAWLSSQIYLQRNNLADLWCNGRNFTRKAFNQMGNEDSIMKDNNPKIEIEKVPIQLDWSKNGTNKTVISELSNRLLFQVSDEMQKEMETILKYDFDLESEGAENAVLRLFNYIVKTPEYQLI